MLAYLPNDARRDMDGMHRSGYSTSIRKDRTRPYTLFKPEAGTIIL